MATNLVLIEEDNDLCGGAPAAMCHLFDEEVELTRPAHLGCILKALDKSKDKTPPL
ncbi:MAG: hypothetical protein LBS77_04975 [Desulfovibrio sp.]|jgi:hypothetical protein|nr:hypothetical protein [Desulfovibrio sp.]